MNRRQIHLIISAFTLVLAFITWWRSDRSAPAAPPVVTPIVNASSTTPVATSATTTNALIVRDVDGDTVVALFDGQKDEVKIRLLGVNTPESVDPRRAVECFGKEASHYTSSTVSGKRVRLDEDPLADNADKYGRLLRNLVLADGTDFNAKLVEDGYAYAYLSFPLNPERKAQLRRLQTLAQTAQRGLWNPQTCNGLK